MDKYYIQNRWKLEGNHLIYYGLRNKENLFKNKIRINVNQRRILNLLPKVLDDYEIKLLNDLINNQVVLENNLRKIPTSLQESRFCRECVANDFMIPGIEFDENGLCPMCQTKEKAEKLKSIIPIMNIIPKSKKSRFDVGLFYTGGKDSTYLLYYLSKILNLKVLAMTWEIPYMSESARRSIENAKNKLINVEFINKKINDQDLRKIYKKLYLLSENNCACPSLAYILFYSDLVENKVPYFIAGNEPVQIQGLYYNHMAPMIAYTFPNNKFLNLLVNIFRVITLKPPFKPGQMHTLSMMKQLAYGRGVLLKLSGYKNELVSNIINSIKEEKKILIPLKKCIKRSSWSGNIPAFVHIDLNEICGGVYDWNDVKATIIKECGWIGPDDLGKGLHTSCDIEKCKEHSQFQRFYNMRSKMIPFSALEISLACKYKNLSKRDAIYELEKTLGFSLEEIQECKIMKDYISG